MIILALDPGLTTGAAKRDSDVISTCVITGNQFDWLNENIFRADVVIVEQFQASVIDKYGLMTVELVGAICALAHIHGVKCFRHPPVFRRPMQQRAHDYLRGLKEKFMIHQEDALAHLFMFEETGR